MADNQGELNRNRKLSSYNGALQKKTLRLQILFQSLEFNFMKDARIMRRYINYESIKRCLSALVAKTPRASVTHNMADFEKAVEAMNASLAKTLSDEDLAEVYGLYKQATVGDVDTDKPADTDVKVSAMHILVT